MIPWRDRTSGSGVPSAARWRRVSSYRMTPADVLGRPFGGEQQLAVGAAVSSVGDVDWIDSKRFSMVPLLSSAARMPLPGATSAAAVAASSSAAISNLPGTRSSYSSWLRPPPRVGRADEQRPGLVAVGDEAADQERLAPAMPGLEPAPGPPAGQVAALEPLGHHPLQPLLAGRGQQGGADPGERPDVCQAGPATSRSSSSSRRLLARPLSADARRLPVVRVPLRRGPGRAPGRRPVACAGAVLAVRYRRRRHRPPGRSVVISAIIGTPIVLAVVGCFVRRRGATRL
jgi:hypothetical protein